MRFFYRSACLFLLAACLSCGAFHSPFPKEPGNLFLRQHIDDWPQFKKDFMAQIPQLKEKGFSAYSFHRDLKDPKTYIVTLKCSNLNRGVGYIQSTYFQTACSGSGAEIPAIWCGVDVRPRHYENRPHPTGGIVIANNRVKSFDFWKACFDAEGQHHHANRGYIASRYSIHHLAGDPDQVMVVHEASDIRKAPAFMTAPEMKGVMEASGVTGIEIWYGYNLEEGTF